MMRDGHNDARTSEQKFKWDEENRLLAVDENGFVSNYWYDADGERTVKTSGENEAIYVNSEFSGGNTGTARFSLYVSPYLVAGQGGKYTKHIYIGSQRIVSKLGDLASYGADPRRIPYAGNEADGLTINYKDKYAQQLQSIKDNYKTFDLPYTGKDNNDYVNGQGFCCNDGTPEAAQARSMARAAIDGNFKPNEKYEKMQFYYHPDHLGSSSYITNLDGEVSQHIEYVPFGEVFIEERNNTWNTPYLFNAKEFDEETGLYYYGARHHDPRLSLWMSTDPMQEKYQGITSYCYTFNNPIRFVDPNGEEGDNPPTLYHNTQHPGKILSNGFNATNNGRYSSYNWFSTVPNASGTGRNGSGVTLGIDVSNAVEIKNSQMREFYPEAKAELGYTSSQLRQSPKLKAQVDALKYEKLGKWMDAHRASVYKLGSNYAIADHVANNGSLTYIWGPQKPIKGLNGIRIAGRVLTLIAVGVDAYEIYSSHYNPRTVTSVVGGWTGAWAGAKFGGMAGTSVGFAVGGVGEVVGTPLGALIGGVCGYFVGRKVTETVYDLVIQKGVPVGGR